MQVAKITLWDGRVFYTDDCQWPTIRRFFDNLRASLKEPWPEGARNQVDLIEMTPAEYQSIPASIESGDLFGATPCPQAP